MAEQPRRKSRGKQPISHHPLFPATVALWCGALLALAGLAFAPPLGSVPRIGIVLAMAVVGVFAGLIVARRIAGPKPNAATAAFEQAVPAARPVALSDSESALWSELHDSLRTLAPEPAATIAEIPAPLPVPEPEPIDAVELESFEAPPTVERNVATEPVAAADPVNTLVTAADRIASAALDELSHVELLERLALSLQRRGHRQQATSDALAPALPEPAPMPLVSDAGYSALLKIARSAPLRQVGGETFGEPAMSFPGHAPRSLDGAGTAAGPQDPEQAERALRDALSALQKISGAA